MNKAWLLVALGLALGSQSLAREAILYDCQPADLRVKSLVFAGPDNTQLDGALIEGGPSLVILSNQSDNLACRWIEFARTLVTSRFSVLFYAYRSPKREEDTAAAAAEAWRQGFKRLILVGASQGAKTSLIAASRKLPGVVAVVSLSAEELMAGQDIKPFAARLSLPVLFITAQHDAFGAQKATPIFYRLAPSRQKHLIVMAGQAHGTQLLDDPRLVARVLGFLSRYR